MNRTFVKTLILILTIAAIPAMARQNRGEIIAVRTVKVDGKLIGVSDGRSPVAFDCGYFSGNIVFTDPDTKELVTSDYDKIKFSTRATRTPYKRLSDRAFNAICTSSVNEFYLDVSAAEVQLIGEPVAYSVKTWDVAY